MMTFMYHLSQSYTMERAVAFNFQVSEKLNTKNDKEIYWPLFAF